MYRYLIYAFIAFDLLRFILYGLDKGKARRDRWRIPEKTLLLVSIPGGVGARLGMKVFRHKTRKWYFIFTVTLFCLLQLAAAGYLAWHGLI